MKHSLKKDGVFADVDLPSVGCPAADPLDDVGSDTVFC